MRIPANYALMTSLFAVVVTAAGATTSTAVVSVSAVVGASCVIGSSPLAFGNYSGTSLDQTASLTVLCTTGTPYTVALDNGTGTGATASLRRMTGPNNQTLAYNVYSDAAHTVSWASSSGVDTLAGTGTGSSQTIQAYGEIPAAQSPSPGAYNDTITVTLTY